MAATLQQISSEVAAPATENADKGAATQKRSHFVNWILAAVLAAGSILGAVEWHLRQLQQVRYDTVLVERGDIQAVVTATGNLNAVVDVQVGSQVSGNIKALYADFNTKVKQGQLVALIDPEMFQAQVDQASSAVASAQSAVVTATAQVEKANADLAGAAANEKNLESLAAKDSANAVNAKAQWDRSQGLFAAGVIARQDYDTASATDDAAQAQVAADLAQVDAAKHNIQSSQAAVKVAVNQLATAQAQERQARAALVQAQINLAHTRILAPVDGTVIARNMNVGQTVAASFQTPQIFDIAQDLTKMQVDTNVDESDVGDVHAGQAATFTVDAYPDIVFSGTVVDVRKAPINAQNVVTYDVVTGVSNPDLKLFPGMTANATIQTAKQENVLKVPVAALRFRPSAVMLKQAGLEPASAATARLYLVEESRLHAVPVKLGLSDGKDTAVVSDQLHLGDQVATRALTTADAPSTSSSSGGSRRLGF